MALTYSFHIGNSILPPPVFLSEYRPDNSLHQASKINIYSVFLVDLSLLRSTKSSCLFIPVTLLGKSFITPTGGTSIWSPLLVFITILMIAIDVRRASKTPIIIPNKSDSSNIVSIFIIIRLASLNQRSCIPYHRVPLWKSRHLHMAVQHNSVCFFHKQTPFCLPLGFPYEC